jgi:hypothetical protein
VSKDAEQFLIERVLKTGQKTKIVTVSDVLAWLCPEASGFGPALPGSGFQKL